MTESPLVTVIIPAYNHENYVQDTIKSIIKQTYANIELIVVDDGSKDSTWQKINEMKLLCEERFSKVIFETKENSGTCETLNLLLSKASGEYIYLIASDDLAKPHTIEMQVEFLSLNPDYALVVGDNDFIDENGKLCYWDKQANTVYEESKATHKTFGAALQHSRKDVDFSSENFGSYASLFAGNYIPNGYLIRKSIFDVIGVFTKEAPLEDYWLMLQIAKYAKIKYLESVLFSYRWHSMNTAKQRAKMIALTQQTKKYEVNLLATIDVSECLPSVNTLLNSGYIIKRKGIPYLYEVLTKHTITGKQKVVKLFNYTLYSYLV